MASGSVNQDDAGKACYILSQPPASSSTHGSRRPIHCFFFFSSQLSSGNYFRVIYLMEAYKKQLRF